MNRRTAVTLAAGASAAAASAYWRHLSPSSQAIGPFPSRAAALKPDGDDATAPPLLALTFDDGPNEPYTTRVADLLQSRGVRATFFQVGRCVERHPGVTRDLAAAGHVVGNHSYSHRFLRGWTAEPLREEILAAEAVLSAELGRRPLLYRPPWLIRTSATFEVLDELGLQPVSGEFCHPLEPFQPSAARMAPWTEAVARPGRIVIFHDGYNSVGADRSQTVSALEMVLDRWLDQGYVFTTVDQLLGVPAYA